MEHFKEGPDVTWLNFIKMALAAVQKMDGKGDKYGDLSFGGTDGRWWRPGINTEIVRKGQTGHNEKWEKDFMITTDLVSF